MGNWDEIRTAYHVARLGTVSGAADALGVHHATVIRHVDALEGRLGAKLFQRHARGYTPTEAGADLLQVGVATDDQFSQLVNRIRGRGETVTGEIVVTSLSAISGRMTPALAEFAEAHEGVVIRFLTDERVFRLEYGEAHVAIRAGAAPSEPDNVVQELTRLAVGLYAHRSYIERHGMPEGESDLGRHRFVSHDDPVSRAPFFRWLRGAVPDDRIVFRATDDVVMRDAVRSGVGIGFMPAFLAEATPDIVPIIPPRIDWCSTIWLVTHVDLHRTPKVQAVTAHLKAAAQTWNDDGCYGAGEAPIPRE
ncbi:LysR family transcriptional regulator [Mesobaculum littorinae]|uniref:LysR family transcriptional regulator n=1 Tax=Mesobaculum littorinae TaxID=2486419 RepID=A0A438AEM4_9RHOB|nr:LysR family transcriptional regulator [Mesobaculum littorinae]RVV97150.1 LysR family transcriptional regulator [Mesobaculum littorinae]